MRTGRLLLGSLVTKLGHECLVAEDGSSAWDLLSSRPIDVLLTDWMMPGIDGPELCRRVRNEPAEHYVYIVLTTGLDHHDHVLEGMGAGADDYLIKPVDAVRRTDARWSRRNGSPSCTASWREGSSNSRGSTSSCWSDR